MHAITSNRILSDGQPFAATTNAPRANGSAKTVCEKRMSRRNRVIGLSSTGSLLLFFDFTQPVVLGTCESRFTLEFFCSTDLRRLHRFFKAAETFVAIVASERPAEIFFAQ